MSNAKRYICIHGHFYQPPRENAWLEEIEIQDSAFPYHDWNERITAECYGPNSVSRRLDAQGKIIDVVNNYARMSFNFGPTLLSWMEAKSPEVYQAILDADRKSLELHNGHGSAIAQVYNHLIMPLANRRDKETQIKWGLYDFEQRFKRKTEGIWLAETAVDTETLELLAENDVKFTILAPRQAASVRKRGENSWHAVDESNLDTLQHYRCNLPSGKSIILFFYNGRVSQKVAFEGLLKDGRAMADALTEAFDPNRQYAQLVHIATDGESYGHHHRYGEMALTYCLHHIESNDLAEITNYARYAAEIETEFEVKIHENTSWSCYHGVERWHANCGCNSGNSATQQLWRQPLRDALDWLRDQLTAEYESQMSIFAPDVWMLRNKYIEVIMNRSDSNVDRFLTENLYFEVEGQRRTKVLRLLEMMRQCQLMYTSCGWFFDEISGIETLQILQYANRAIQIAETESNLQLDEQFKSILTAAPSNNLELGNGRRIYETLIEPSRLSLTKVGMHYVVNALFAENPERLYVMSFGFESDFFERLEAGMYKLAVGRTTIRSKITCSEKHFSFAVIYLGQHHIIGSATEKLQEADFMEMYETLRAAFHSGNLAEVIHLISSHFGSQKFSFWELFKDEQKKVLNHLLQKETELAEVALKGIYDRNYNLMNVLQQVNIPMPLLFKNNLELVLNNQLRKYFQQAEPKANELKRLVEEVRKWQLPIEKDVLSYVATLKLNEMLADFEEDADQLAVLINLHQILQQIQELDLEPDLWKLQNRTHQIGRLHYAAWQKEALKGVTRAKEMKWFYDLLAQRLNISLELIAIKLESVE